MTLVGDPDDHYKRDGMDKQDTKFHEIDITS